MYVLYDRLRTMMQCCVIFQSAFFITGSLKMIKKMIVGGLMLLTMSSQLVFANTETKAPPPGPGPLFTASTIGNNLTVNTNIPGVTYQFAGVASLTSGFNFTGCTLYGNGYCLFPANNTVPKTLVLAGSAPNPTFKLCLDAAGKTYSCERATIGSRFAYVSNNFNGATTITKCSVNSLTGALSNCVAYANGLGGTGGRELALNPSGTYIYQANNGNTQSLSYCPISPTDGSVGACQFATAITTENTNNYDGVAINAAGTLLYVANQDSGNVYTCSINQSTGDVPTCVLTGSTANNETSRITLNPAGTFAYISAGHGTAIQPGADTIYQCTINPSTGILSGCVNSNATLLNFPVGIQLNSTGTLAYITNHGTNSITTCQVVTGTGRLADCSNTVFTPALNQPAGIQLNSTGTRLYVANENNSAGNEVAVCLIAAGTGIVSSCTTPGDTNILDAFGITLL